MTITTTTSTPDPASRTARPRSDHSVGELVVDDAGNILSINPAMSALLDLGTSSVDAVSWQDLAERSDLSGLVAMALPPFPEEPRSTWFRFDGTPPTVGILQVRAVAWPGADRAAIVSFTAVNQAAASGSGAVAPTLGAPALWFEVAFGSNVIGTALLGEHGRVIAYNRALVDLVGAGDRAFAVEALHPNDVEETVQAVARGWTGHAVSIDHRLVRPDGSMMAVHSNVLPVVLDGQQYLLLQSTPSATAHQTGDRRTDPLTGLLDREGVGQAIAQAVEGRAESGTDFAVLSIDIDDFRSVNAAIGTVAADEVLTQVGARMRALLPPDADIGRVNADRFIAVMEVPDQDHLFQLASGVVEQVGLLEPKGLGYAIRVRAGALFVATDDQRAMDVIQTVEQITQAARLRPDRTMLRVLRDRSDSIASIGESHVREWCRSVETALGQDSFAAVAEPLRPLTDSVKPSVEYYELLVRLILPSGEWMSLPKFERLAVRLDRRTHIDRWMTGRAMRYLKSQPSLNLEVNLTRATMHDETAVQWFAEQIVDADIDPSKVLFAVDERIVADELTFAVGFANAMRDRGLGLCIDNFGAFGGGARELELIRPRRVKLPGQIVSHSAAERSARATLADLVGIADDANVQTAAVFVSDADVYEVVGELGIDLAQGWHIGRAVSLEVR